uniref:Uncharacterized protein n=1 Tax=Cucumis sativus TaxID=3659 RepID=A0A0A0K1Z4_CUCSA
MFQQSNESLSSSGKFLSIDNIVRVEYNDMPVDDHIRSRQADYPPVSQSNEMDENIEHDLSDGDGERGVHTMDEEGNEYDLSVDGEKGNVEQNGEHNEENNL